MSAFLKDDATRALQRFLIDRGAKLGNFGLKGDGVDGDWGNVSDSAFRFIFAKYFDQASEPAVAPPVPQTFGEVLADVALTQVGIREVDGSNSGPHIQKYQRATWLDGTGWPWCAAFICWCVREGLAKTGDIEMPYRPKTAGAWDFEKWARGGYGDNGDLVHLINPARPAEIRRGDILVYEFSHIGIADGPPDATGRIPTIEGNTNAAGSREGDGVFAKTRRPDQVRSMIRITA